MYFLFCFHFKKIMQKLCPDMVGSLSQVPVNIYSSFSQSVIHGPPT